MTEINNSGTMMASPMLRPQAVAPSFEQIPSELKVLPNWVCWRFEPPNSDGKKWRKVPYQINHRPASTTDPATWNSFEACCSAHQRGGFDGLGFVFDGATGPDGLCYCGIDLDACISDDKLQSLARHRIKRLNTYTELSVSGTGLHCIARGKPLDHIVKFDGVEIYTNARYFTFTGKALFGDIKAAPADVAALVSEVRKKEAIAKQKPDHSGPITPEHFEIPDSFKNAKPATAFETLDPTNDSLADGITAAGWFAGLSPDQKDEVVAHALEIIAKSTRLFELEANGGNNTEYYKLTTAVARSGAPHAEDIFVKFASAAKDADPEGDLRDHFRRCHASQAPPGQQQGITVGTLLRLAQENGADFNKWKGQAASADGGSATGQTGTPSGPTPYRAIPVSSLPLVPPKRMWLHGADLIRGAVSVLYAPGGRAKSTWLLTCALACASGRQLLGSNVFGGPLRVLCISTEDGMHELALRLRAAMTHHGLTDNDVPGLYVIGADQ